MAALAETPVATLHVEYMVELLPYTDLHVAVWYDEEQSAFIAEFRGGVSATHAIPPAQLNPQGCP